MAAIEINNIEEVAKIQLGDAIIVNGPDDPVEFYAFQRTIDAAIDRHVAALIESQNKAEPRTIVRPAVRNNRNAAISRGTNNGK